VTAGEPINFAYKRYWLLHELGRIAACLEIGTMASATATKERRGLQKDLLELRAQRNTVRLQPTTDTSLAMLNDKNSKARTK
jgi:hypothetical protein